MKKEREAVFKSGNVENMKEAAKENIHVTVPDERYYAKVELFKKEMFGDVMRALWKAILGTNDLKANFQNIKTLFYLTLIHDFHARSNVGQFLGTTLNIEWESFDKKVKDENALLRCMMIAYIPFDQGVFVEQDPDLRAAMTIAGSNEPLKSLLPGIVEAAEKAYKAKVKEATDKFKEKWKRDPKKSFSST